MLKLFRLFLIPLALSSSILLQGCAVLIVPIEYALAAGESKKNVSGNFNRGHVVGKQYELLQDINLTQFEFGEDLHLGMPPIRSYKYDTNGSMIEIKTYALIKKISKGTKFKVTTVLVKTSFGDELCSQYILANLIDEQGNTISQANSYGEIVPVDVSYLFKDTWQKPDQNWFFEPNSEFITEINSN